jgi:Zn-dependent peptidase ImmA (M78 family)
MELYQSSILHEAIVRAAKIEREASFRYDQDILNIPINVHRIAWKKGIRIAPSLSRNAREDGFLRQKDDGYLLHLKSNMSQRRERFTIAHEIGHTLFYRNRKHQIGILDKKELSAEERICNKFAITLLVPPEFIHQIMPQIPVETPLQVMHAIENTCSKFNVSLPALIPRLKDTYKSKDASLILLIFRFKKNRFKGTEQRLRVYGSCSLGEFKNIIIPFNQSANSLNLNYTEKLFEEWRCILRNGERKAGGMFRLNAEGNIIRRIPYDFGWIDKFEWTEEELCLSGKKRNINKYNLLSSNVLVSRNDWNEDQAYIVTIIRSK